jgi:hypothetical protein
MQSVTSTPVFVNVPPQAVVRQWRGRLQNSLQHALPTQQQVWQWSKKTGQNLWQQPSTQWVAKQYYYAGKRDYKANSHLHHAIAEGWRHALNVTGHTLNRLSKWLPHAPHPSLTATLTPIKQQLAAGAKRSHSWANWLSNNPVGKKAVGSLTFFAGYLPLSLLWLSPHLHALHLSLVYVGLGVLRGGAVAGPIWEQTQHLLTLERRAMARQQVNKQISQRVRKANEKLTQIKTSLYKPQR